MAVTRIGATRKYADNWSLAFAGKTQTEARTSAAKQTKTVAPAAKKKMAPKTKRATGKKR